LLGSARIVGTARLVGRSPASPNGLAGAPLVLSSLYRVTLPLLSPSLRSEATMKAVPLAFCLATSACGVAFANESANESRHSAIVDMPGVITLTDASPDTWHTLLPVQPNDRPTLTAASAFGDPVFGQVGPFNRSAAQPTYLGTASLLWSSLTPTSRSEGDYPHVLLSRASNWRAPHHPCGFCDRSCRHNE
jgi:hypothetical protein